MGKKFADTPAKRFLKLGAMGAKVASTYTGSKIRQALGAEEDKEQAQAQLYNDIGEQVMQTLGELKGAAMKVGQIASQFQQLLPPEFSRQIAKLQQHSPAMPIDVIQKQIKTELGFTPEQLFASFDEAPFAAASIGQVHRATLRDGREVILKVQYPGVHQSCRSDLVQLKRLFMLSGLMKVEKSVMDELFKDIESNLMAELDYGQEAHNLKVFRAFHHDNPNIVIPEVIDDFSTERVLCLSYEPGDAMADLRGKGYTQDMINLLGEHLISAILQELLYHLRVHCDPHPGNFAFRKDGKVVIYDYGAVIDVQDLVIDQYIDVAEAALNGEFDKIDPLLIQMGVRNPAIPAMPTQLYEDLFNDLIKPVLHEVRPANIFHQVQPAITRHMKDLLALRGAFQPSTATLFINRVLGGHFLNLVQMDTDKDYKPLVLSHIFQEES